MQRVMKIIYEGIMILLVMITIITLWTNNTYNTAINWVVWGVFFTDFLFRFFLSKQKWNFVKSNPFLIIAIIPFDQFFQIARVVRLFYLFRIKTIAKYYITPYFKKLTYQSVTVIMLFFLLLLLGESFILWKVESFISSYLESVSVVFGHLLFFGHRIFVIEHSISIWLLTVTSIVGIVIQGLVLQWAFSKMEQLWRRVQRDNESTRVS